MSVGFIKCISSYSNVDSFFENTFTHKKQINTLATSLAQKEVKHVFFSRYELQKTVENVVYNVLNITLSKYQLLLKIFDSMSPKLLFSKVRKPHHSFLHKAHTTIFNSLSFVLPKQNKKSQQHKHIFRNPYNHLFSNSSKLISSQYSHHYNQFKHPLPLI